MYTAYGQRMRAALTRAQSLENVISDLRSVVAKIPKTVSDRVRATGSGAKGQFSGYSNFWSKKRGGAGLQTSKKDFSFTGSMWADYKIVKEELTGRGITFTLTSDVKGNNGEALVDIHSKPRTRSAKGGTQGEGQNILDLNEDEESALDEAIGRVIEKNLDAILRV